MIILSHRGYWKLKNEQNQDSAFELSFQHGFGVETDLRDNLGRIVVSHDVPFENCKKCTSLEHFFKIYKQFSHDFPLALNIKADGLQVLLKELLGRYSINNYFVFDMSVPDALGYLKAGLNTFTRQSEYEMQPSFYDQACGVWIDEFHSHWITQDIIEGHLRGNKKVCIVSPELHKREYMKEWAHYKEIAKNLDTHDLMICTDYPDQARGFFGE